MSESPGLVDRAATAPVARDASLESLARRSAPETKNLVVCRVAWPTRFMRNGAGARASRAEQPRAGG